MCLLVLFFKEMTAYDLRISDWSSDVCSSDLAVVGMQCQPVGLGFDAATVAPLGPAQFRLLVNFRALPVAVDPGGGEIADPGEAGEGGYVRSVTIERGVAGDLAFAVRLTADKRVRNTEDRAAGKACV